MYVDILPRRVLSTLDFVGCTFLFAKKSLVVEWKGRLLRDGKLERRHTYFFVGGYLKPL